MNAFLSLIPARYRDKAKAIVALLGSLVTAALAALPSDPEWLTAAAAFLTAFGVYAVPNVIEEAQ